MAASERYRRRGGLTLLRGVIPEADDDRPGARDVRTALAVEALGTRARRNEIVPVAEVGVMAPARPVRMLPTVAFYLLIWADVAEFAYGECTKASESGRADGRLVNVALALANRAYAAMRLGRLREAEADARAAWRLAVDHTRGVHRALGTLVWALVEQGALDDAESEWTAGTARDPGWAERPDIFATSQLALNRARLSLARGAAGEAAAQALEVGEALRDRGLDHLAISGWQNVAVGALLATGRTDEAAAIATGAMMDARSFGSPTALAEALRLRALTTSDRGTQIALLKEAASHLDDVASPVERARTLVQLGAALRRNKQRVDSREPLRLALDLAARAGAARLAERASEELRAAGGRARRTMLSGVESLTASELRVAQLAAEGSQTRRLPSGCTSPGRRSRRTCPDVS